MKQSLSMPILKNITKTTSDFTIINNQINQKISWELQAILLNKIYSNIYRHYKSILKTNSIISDII